MTVNGYRPAAARADEPRELARLLLPRISERLAEHVRERQAAGLGALDAVEHQSAVERMVAEQLQVHARAELSAGRAVPTPQEEARARQAVVDALLGTGVLERLLADETVENISVNGCDNVWLRHADRTKRRGPALAGSDDELIELVRLLAARTGAEERRFDRANPRLYLTLPDGSRLTAVMALCERVSLSIRRHRFPAADLADLVRLRVCDEDLAGLLGALVRGRFNLLIAGGTDMGKTTVLRALASAIPATERLVTIEDTFELGLDKHTDAHPDVVALQAREANIEGAGAVDQAELVRWGLRMHPDRVIVGEIRGSEVVPMCNAMSQGNDGSMSTIHASGSKQAFTKLATYAAQAPERLSLEATNLMVASAVHFVIHLGRDTDGVRCVTSIREVTDADGAQVVSNEVCMPGPDRRARPAVPLRNETTDKLLAAGLEPRVLERWWRRSV
ncbi:CpaF family protein [Streptomyces boninensis]|uniref:CpaF family protein n=1 Tax=Streptomyces boninensis TaxID=2039455 RepID=UPI003B22198F